MDRMLCHLEMILAAGPRLWRLCLTTPVLSSALQLRSRYMAEGHRDAAIMDDNQIPEHADMPCKVDLFADGLE